MKKVIKNEKSLKKDGEKNLSEGDSSESFFRPSFFNDFSFFNHLFQGFNPPLDDFWPLMHTRRKNNLLPLNNLQVNEICPVNLVSMNYLWTIRKAMQLSTNAISLSMEKKVE